jgi:DNA ligase (NAD+)
MQTVEGLNQKLTAAREAYYAGQPIMSDAEYDAAEIELATLVKLNPAQTAAATVLSTVGTDAGGRIPHAHPMRSIENVYSEEDLVTWYRKQEGKKVTLASKWDGVSCSLTYDKGKLVKAVTRGDGDAGESILPQIQATFAVPNEIGYGIDLEIRGELVMKQSTLAKLNADLIATGGKPYMSTRNLVAGTMKLRDLEEVKKRDIQFKPWEVMAPLLDSSVESGDSASERLSDLILFGFDVPDDVAVSNETELLAELAKFRLLLGNKDEEIGRDGIVIKIDSCARRRELGLGSKFANFQVAFKTQNAKSESVLLDVIWQVGRQGKLTPVGVLEPVVLAGATIQRVTLTNITWIRAMGLEIGSRVEVVRSGDVIPQITAVLDV